MKTESIIIIEDNDTMRLGMVDSLRSRKFIITSYDNGPEALKNFSASPADIAVIDLKMEPMDGIDVLQKIKEIHSATEVLIVSAFGTIEIAVKAIQLGAADFLTKPFSPDELRLRIDNLVQKIKREKEFADLLEHNRLLSQEIDTNFEDIIGVSQPMQHIFSLIEKIAVMDSPVLIEGESGTGKELVARAIHKKSTRKDKPFIRINCGALNDNLLESELFGHEKGAFTGAIRLKKGRFELAHQGTLFLDEIGDISSAMQVKLLRVLQDGEFERVGGEYTIKSDVRIITATNKDLQKRISENHFREDLYYRICVIPVKLPALRERKKDIPLLANHFIEKITRRTGQPYKKINNQAMRLMLSYTWPGNIRELENLVERLFVISGNDEIGFDLVARHLSIENNITDNFENMALEESLYQFEKKMITQAMQKAGGVKNRAAKLLGIKTSALYYKLEKFGII